MIGDVIESEPKLRDSHARLGLYSRLIKRVLDLLLVLLALPAVVTLVILLAFLIRADGGPAFYSQERVGRGGKVFRLWKLRSMEVDADRKLEELLECDLNARSEWQESQKLRSDPRITPIGHIIRKTSLDELPQVWNILVGDMSLVGPRPFMPDQQELYIGQDYYKLRPGLTGLWQVTDRNGSSFSARAHYDSLYFRKMSLSADVRILFETVSVVMRGTGY